MAKSETLSDAFLKEQIGRRVKIFLSSGIALVGTLKNFDPDSIIISGKYKTDSDSLVERLQVSTVQLEESEDEKKSSLRRR